MGTGKVIRPLRDKGWQIFTRPFELNIIGLRNKVVLPNTFEDELHVIYRDTQGKTFHHIYKITTDPGTYWLEHPDRPQGTAILKEGQNLNAYKIGLHRGKYLALVQAEPVTVLRDYDRNAVLDFNNGREETGMFGIEIHRAQAVGKTYEVDKYSAGCQVFQDAGEFQEFMSLCEKHRKLYGNRFTYTLIDFRSTSRALRKHYAYLMMSFVALAVFLVKGEQIFDLPFFHIDSFLKTKGKTSSAKSEGRTR